MESVVPLDNLWERLSQTLPRYMVCGLMAKMGPKSVA